MTLSLGDLMSESEFGLRMVVSPEGCLKRRIEGVHSIEIADPMRFLRAGWVMLCNGVRLKNRPDEQRRLIADLDHGQITALGFGLGEFFQRLPRALLAEAQARDLPMFVIEQPTPFRDIVGFVGQTTLHHDVYHLRRALAVNDELMDCLLESDPEDTVVRRLADALHGTAALFGSTGALEHAHGAGVTDELWTLTSDVRELREVVAGQRRGWVAPVVADGRPRRWLVFTSELGNEGEHLVRRVMRTAQRLLELVEVGRAAATGEIDAVQAELLVELMTGRTRPLATRLAARARRQGVTFVQPARMAIFALRSDLIGRNAREMHLLEARERLARKFDWLGLPHLLAPHAGTLVALVEGEPDLVAIAAELAAEGCAFLVGVGRLSASAGGVPDSFRDARLALAELERGGQAPSVLSSDRLGLTATIVNELPQDTVRQHVDHLLGELRGHPALYETLIVHLDCDLEISRTAARLHLHPNSLRYRLGRVEKLLGRSLRRVPDIADLHLATMLDRASTNSERM